MKKKVLIIFLIVIAIGSLAAWWGFQKIYKNNLRLDRDEQISFFVSTGCTLSDLMNQFDRQNLLLDKQSFYWLANFKNLEPRPGRYILKAGMNNFQLYHILKSGLQTPVKVTFNNLQTLYDLAGVVGRQIEADSVEIIGLLTDKSFLRTVGFDFQTLPCMFIPNTYEFYWNTNAEGFAMKMKKEYDKFWTEERKAKAGNIGLSPLEVAVLASIVQAEQRNHAEERPVIARLYLNRLRIRMPLQSDPTLIFAAGDFSITRVLNRHKEIDSPYNTYLYPGLPPGPILFPEKSSVDAVLNPDDNDYLFMCAKEDFSGFHNFAKTNDQHIVYARKFRSALNKKGIYR